MKLIISFCLLIFSSVFLFGQEAEAPISASKEFGLDATFINKFLPFENEIGNTNDYLFSYRITKANKRFTRVGFDVDFDFGTENNENEREQSNSQIGFDFRVGGGKSRQVHKRLTLFTGFDWTLGFSYASVKVGSSGPGNSDSNRNEATTFETGFGPFIGLQFNITEKFGLYTEADFYANLKYEVSKFESFSLPGLSDENERISFGDKITLPGTLVLFYRFN